MNRLPWDPIAEARRNWRQHGWDDAADGMAVITSITRVHQLLTGRIETVLKPHGITFARFEMLRLLAFAHERTLPMSRARDLLQIHPASVTNIVDRLAADHLVERLAHPDDGRSVLLRLTDAGADVIEAATADLNREVFADTGFEDDEVAQLSRILASFRERAGDFKQPRSAPDPL